MGELEERIKKIVEEAWRYGAISHMHMKVDPLIKKLVEEMTIGFPDLFQGVKEKQLSREELSNLLVKQNRERWYWFQRWLK